MGNEMRLTDDEAIGIFDKHGHRLRSSRRAVFELVVLRERSHRHVVEAGHVPTVGASRAELRRARQDLDRLAVERHEIRRIEIERMFAVLPVFVSEHSRRDPDD
jgi:hypothetical protein